MWTSTDPDDQYWNSYSYVGGHPIVMIDPTGENGLWLVGMLAGAAIGGTIGYAASDGDWRVAAMGAVFGGFVGAGIGSTADWAMESMGYNIDYAAAAAAVQKAARSDAVGQIVIHSVEGANLLRPFRRMPNFTLPITYGDHAFPELQYNPGAPRLGAGPGEPVQVFGTWPGGLKVNSSDELAYMSQSSQRSYPITRSDLSKIGNIINKTANQQSAWSPFSPCSDFASNTWQDVAGEKNDPPAFIIALFRPECFKQKH